MKTVYITRNALFKNIPMILCNNISKVDESFIEDNMHLYEQECETCEGSGKTTDAMGQELDCEDCNGNGRNDLEVYQEFIIAVDKWDIENLKSYGVEVGYSEALDVHVLPIYDFGTSWSAFSYSKEVEDDYDLAHNETLTRETVY